MKHLFWSRQFKKILFICLGPVRTGDSEDRGTRKAAGIVLRQVESVFARARQESAGKEGHVLKQKIVRHLPRFTRFSPIYRKADNSILASWFSNPPALWASMFLKRSELWHLKFGQLSLRRGSPDQRAITGQSTVPYSRQNDHSSGKGRVICPFENCRSPALHAPHI